MDLKDARAKKDSKEEAKATPPPSIKTFAVSLWKCFFLSFSVCCLPENEGKTI